MSGEHRAAVLDVLKLVAGADGPVDESTSLVDAGIDSLSLVESVVHLELAIGRGMPKEFANRVAADSRFRTDMAVGDLATVVADLLPTPGGES